MLPSISPSRLSTVMAPVLPLLLATTPTPSPCSSLVPPYLLHLQMDYSHFFPDKMVDSSEFKIRHYVPFFQHNLHFKNYQSHHFPDGFPMYLLPRHLCALDLNAASLILHTTISEFLCCLTCIPTTVLPLIK